MRIELPLKRRQLLFAACGLSVSSLAAKAGTGPHYSARLIAGATRQRIWRAGLDITLDKGWKTYWRMPGDAGVPPQFDWSRSRNVKSFTVLWPAPSRFTDASGETVGYKDRVVFPFDIAAEDAGQPIHLVLDAFLGVCEIVCIPVKLEMSLTQSQATSPDAGLIDAFAALVPQKATAQSRFHVASAALVPVDGKFALAVRLAGDGFGDDLDIFVEGSDFAYFREPRRAGGKADVQLPIDGLKDPAKLRGRPLTLTMVSGDIRLEQEVVVD